MFNSIYIRRKSNLYLERGQEKLPDEYLLNLLKNIESLGYTFSPELAEVVGTLSVQQVSDFYHQLIADLRMNVGAHVAYQPMYPDFPGQVQAMTTEELYANAFWHYLGDWIGTRLMPSYEKQERIPLQDNVSLKVIGWGTAAEFTGILTRLLLAKSSLSATDKTDVAWFVTSYRERVFDMVPDEIPQKENAAFFVALLLQNKLEAGTHLDKHIKTATDVLRVAVALSGGDVSLAAPGMFKSISKPNRKLLLGALERMGTITEDMLRYPGRWKRLGEKLHPFEYKKRFPKCFAAFDVIRNDKPFETFNSRVEQALLQADIPALLELLKSRPGELARRLDKLLRIASQPQDVIDQFQRVSAGVSSPVLLQVHAHFKHRSEPRELRTFFPKGNVGKAMAIDNNLPPLSPAIINSVVSLCEDTLLSRFKNYKPLGKVFIDETLRQYTVPLAQRAASKALKTLARGSRVALPDGDTLRFFVYWKEGNNRADIDLSALALDDRSGFKMAITYYNLKDIGGFHSGDITSAPEGASEFIDLQISACLEQGIRYVLMSVNSFTDQPYCDLPICFAGFMIRQFPNSGEIFEPLTVQNKFDLTADTRISIPLIVDLQERNVIWTDIALASQPAWANNIHNNLSSVSIINKSMTTLAKPNLYELLSWHAKARGEQSLDINEATTIFAVDKGIKPTDIDILVSEFL